MTVNELIAKLQRIVADNPWRGEFRVIDVLHQEIDWIRYGCLADDHKRIVTVLPEVD